MDTYADLPPVEGWEVWPADVNNKGQVAGTVFHNPSWTSYGFLYENGDYQFFEHPTSTFFAVSGVNDHGHIVRNAYDEASDTWKAFLFKDSVTTTINATKDARTTAAGINNAGNIVGAFYRPGDEWDASGFRAAPKPPKKPATVATR